MAIYSNGQVGWFSGSVNVAPSQDADALAFITAANITDTTQKSAINTLVTQLKTYGIWTKLKAVYPFVGGTASSHKFNLKDPRDLDAAYRLVFNGGWTHSSTGALPNGSNAFADTKLVPNASLTQWNTHLSYYSRTSTRISTSIEIGSYDGISSNLFSLILPRTSGLSTSTMYSQATSTDEARTTTATDASGLFIGTRTSNTANTHKLFRNGSVIGTASTSAGTLLSNPLYIGAMRTGGSAGAYSNKESAFASIGDGLTDTEAANFYTAVQTFQTTLGRQVGVPIVADSDAQAFLNAAVITDQTQANAINTLVTDLKSANIWTKMKAIYPFVGGTATTHKFNLKDPRDLDAAFRLSFVGGGLHDSFGYKPNGTNGYADTFLTPSVTQTLNSNGLGYYVTSNTANLGNAIQMGANNNTSRSSILSANTSAGGRLNGSIINGPISNDSGHFSMQRTSSTLTSVYQNNTLIASGNSGGTLPSFKIFIGTIFNNGSVYTSGFVNCYFRIAYISDGLDSTDMTNLYNAVQTYQTTLGRQV